MAKRKRRRFTPEFKAEVVLEALRGDSSQAALCRRHNLSEDQLSKWKQQAVENIATGFTSTDKQANEVHRADRTPRTARWTVDAGVGNPKKGFLDVVELNTSTQRYIVETLRADFSVRQICEVLGINKSTVYYQAKNNPSEDILREEIEQLAETRYPTYGYRRITKLLVRMGHCVGYRRVARLMKAANLSAYVSNASVKQRPLVKVCTRGAIASKTLRSHDAIRSGWAILPTSTSRHTSSM